MERKKSNKADLEKRTPFFVQIGLIIALSIVLVAFEWTKGEDINDNMEMVQEIQFEDEMMQITRREEPKPPEPEQPMVAEVLDIVDDDILIEDDFNFDMEATDDSEYDFTSMLGDDEEEIEEQEIFYIVEDMPTFNGGDLNEFNRYVVKNLRYPEIAAENGISGRVIIQFMVDETGTVRDIEIIRSVDPALDKESIRVVASSPKWIPGKQRGKPVRVLFTFPINFILQ